MPHELNVVLVEPKIPVNTGAIGRLCLATGSTLHLVEPLGFEINDTANSNAPALITGNTFEWWFIKVWTIFLLPFQRNHPKFFFPPKRKRFFTIINSRRGRICFSAVRLKVFPKS